jgi:tetratricopeptide (TPR) repeat protein
MEYSFEQKEAALSVYTQYLVEGLGTGIADLDGDGWIGVDELHEFAEGKVREVAPAMQPRFYGVEQGHKILLAQAPRLDPKLEYRQEAERLAQERRGKLSSIVQRGLAEKFRGRVSESDAAAILQEVLHPYQELEQKLKRFEKAVMEFMALPPEEQILEDLQYFQQALGLRDIDTEAIKQRQGFQCPKPDTPLVASADSSETLPTSKTEAPQPPLQSSGGFWSAFKNFFTPEPTAEDFLEQGNEKYRNQDYQGAFADYDRAIQLKPDYAIAYYNRGGVRSALGDKKGAISDFDRAIQLNSDDATTYHNRGVARSALGDNEGAFSDYDRAIRLKPDDAKAYNNQGIARGALGDNEGAFSDYDRAIQINPDLAEAYNNRGLARRNLGDNEGAISDYDRAIQIKPDYATAYVNRGDARRDLGNNAGAIQDYQKALELYPPEYPNRQTILKNLKALQP